MRGHHKKIGQSVEGLYVYLVAGEGDTGSEAGAGHGGGERSAGRAFADEESVPGELGVLGLQQFECGD